MKKKNIGPNNGKFLPNVTQPRGLFIGMATNDLSCNFLPSQRLFDPAGERGVQLGKLAAQFAALLLCWFAPIQIGTGTRVGVTIWSINVPLYWVLFTFFTCALDFHITRVINDLHTQMTSATADDWVFSFTCTKALWTIRTFKNKNYFSVIFHQDLLPCPYEDAATSRKTNNLCSSTSILNHFVVCTH